MSLGLSLESLEPRVFLSRASATGLTWDDVAAGKLTGSGVRLDLVVLHELGHSLGLQHSSDPNSIMYAYYNANYNINNFANDSVIPSFQSKYANVSTSPWKDSLDPNPGNGKVEITYSYVPDGTPLDKGSSTLFSALDHDMSRSTWQGIFAEELGRWAGASNNKVGFVSHSDSGLAFNFSGSVQNDSRHGDIRIGAHRFDGPGKTLAHTYYPPPTNSGTAAGDLHLDAAERWVAPAAAAVSVAPSTTSPTSWSAPHGGTTFSQTLLAEM